MLLSGTRTVPAVQIPRCWCKRGDVVEQHTKDFAMAKEAAEAAEIAAKNTLVEEEEDRGAERRSNMLRRIDSAEMLVLFFDLNRELGSWINLNQDPGSTFEMHVLIYFFIKNFLSIIKIPDMHQK